MTALAALAVILYMLILVALHSALARANAAVSALWDKLYTTGAQLGRANRRIQDLESDLARARASR